MISEIWKPIIKYRGYSISNTGKIKSHARSVPKSYAGISNSRTQFYKERIRATRLNVCGYEYTTLSVNNIHKSLTIHRQVALAFIPNPLNLPQVNHIDGNKLNNHVNNLEWCTASENQIHAYKTGLHQIAYGEKASRSKLKEADIMFMRQNKGSLSKEELSLKFNTSKGHVSDIQRGKYWSHIGGYNG